MRPKVPSKAFQKVIKERVAYNPITGKLTWKVAASNMTTVGDICGSKHLDYYRCKFTLRGKTIRVMGHCVAWFLSTGRWPTNLIDHKNRNGLDNRLKNLREATYAQNTQNAKNTKNSTGLRGVRLEYNYAKTKVIGYRGQIEANKHYYYSDMFDTAEEASSWYRSMQRKLHGKFAVKIETRKKKCPVKLTLKSSVLVRRPSIAKKSNAG